MINFLKDHFCTIKFLKFVILGFWNTLFGVGIFFLLYYWFGRAINYMFLVVVANVLAITNAYIVYKIFVFKTRGNYFREYLRFYVVYGMIFLVGIALFPVFMEIILPFFARHLPNYYGIFNYKAYLSQIGVTTITMFFSYFGHHHFSYRKKGGGV